MEIQLTFCELRRKDVINIVDGRKLGRIIDIVFNIKGQIQGLVTPGIRRWGIFKSNDNIFVPWRDIKKIGEDVIIVELRPDSHKSRRHDDSDMCCFDERGFCDDDERHNECQNNNHQANGSNKNNSQYYNQSNNPNISNQYHNPENQSDRDNYSAGSHNGIKEHQYNEARQGGQNVRDIDYFMKYYHND